jgi:hypothetical protein
MKRKNSLGLFSGLALGLGSIYALSVYFDLTNDQLKGLLVSTVTLLVAMFILAALLVGIMKLCGKLLRMLRGKDHEDIGNDQE